MTNPDHTTATELLTDAARVAAQLSVDASVTAKEVIATAAEAAQHEKDRHATGREETKMAFIDALNQVFGEKIEKEQFINLSRVPFLCTNVKEIHSKLEGIVLVLEEMRVVKRMAYGIVGLFGSALVVAFGIILSLALRK